MASSKGGKKRRRGKGKSRNNDHGLLAAVRHPLRRKILQLMSDGRKASPSELARKLGEPLSSVAYHVRVLAEFKALQSVSEREAGGSMKHFYRRSEVPEWVRAILEGDEEQSS